MSTEKDVQILSGHVESATRHDLSVSCWRFHFGASTQHFVFMVQPWSIYGPGL